MDHEGKATPHPLPPQPEGGATSWATHPPTEPWYAPVGELWDEPGSQLEWLVDGLLPRDGVSLTRRPPQGGQVHARANAVRHRGATGSRTSWAAPSRTARGSAFYAFLEGSQRSVRSAFKRMNGPERTGAPPPRPGAPWGRHWRTLTAPSRGGPRPRRWRSGSRCSGTRSPRRRRNCMVVDTLGRLAGLDDLNDYGPVVKALGPRGGARAGDQLPHRARPPCSQVRR